MGLLLMLLPMLLLMLLPMLLPMLLLMPLPMLLPMLLPMPLPMLLPMTLPMLLPMPLPMGLAVLTAIVLNISPPQFLQLQLLQLPLHIPYSLLLFWQQDSFSVFLCNLVNVFYTVI